MGLSIVRTQGAARRTIPPDWRPLLDRFPDNIREIWEERAAIIQYEGNEPRPTAERRAFECIVVEYEPIRLLVQDHVAALSGAASRA